MGIAPEHRCHGQAISECQVRNPKRAEKKRILLSPCNSLLKFDFQAGNVDLDDLSGLWGEVREYDSYTIEQHVHWLCPHYPGLNFHRLPLIVDNPEHEAQIES